MISLNSAHLARTSMVEDDDIAEQVAVSESVEGGDSLTIDENNVEMFRVCSSDRDLSRCCCVRTCYRFGR